MSHSQFHCTGRAYLDMHGLIFETSICYWQDQPGRRARGARETAPPRRDSGRGPDVPSAGGKASESERAGARGAAGARGGWGARGTAPTPARRRAAFPAPARRTDRPGTRGRGRSARGGAVEGRARGAPHAGGGPDGGRVRRATWHPGRRVESRDTRAHGRGAPRAGARGPPPGGGAWTAITTAGRDPVAARARPSERGRAARDGTLARPHATTPPRRAAAGTERGGGGTGGRHATAGRGPRDGVG